MTDPTKPIDDATDATASGNSETTNDASAAGGEVGALQQQLADARDRHLRLAAEYDNFRRRAVKERQEAGWRAQGDLVSGLIDSLDDIMRFAHVDTAATDVKTVVDGIQMVEKKVFKSLSGHGLELISPLGQPFDPARHEAVSTTPASSALEDGTVAAVFQVGYIINGHLLRPARVVVKQWSGIPVS